jgi:DNA-directed RNA polymerase subunit RPC12/RpoP
MRSMSQVHCPHCRNRPNECVRSRWYKQWCHWPLLRARWRCLRCGDTFGAWLWSHPPADDSVRRAGEASPGELKHR